jgi:hypothetical protein
MKNLQTWMRKAIISGVLMFACYIPALIFFHKVGGWILIWAFILYFLGRGFENLGIKCIMRLAQAKEEESVPIEKFRRDIEKEGESRLGDSVYKYEAICSDGKEVYGRIDATDESEAIDKVKKMGYFPTKIDKE